MRPRVWAAGVSILAGAALVSLAGPAAAQVRDFCPDRPGLGTPPCTVDQGRAVLEVGLIDWSRVREAAIRTDTTLAGDMLVRVGVSDTIEAQVGWTAFGRVSSRDPLDGSDAVSGSGDISLALRKNLRSPDGSGTSAAVMIQATFPVGREPIGEGEAGLVVLVPMSFELPAGLALGLTPQLEMTRDPDGDGVLTAFGSVVGIGGSITDRLSLSAEISVMHQDGDGEAILGGLSAGWQLSENLQLDAGINVDLENAGAGRQVYVGLARRF